MDWKVLLGLTVCYFVYLVIGGAVFSAIERPTEQAQCEEIQEEVSFLAAKIREAENITIDQLKNFTKVIQAAADYGIIVDENFNVTCQINWDFSSAFFFSGTVITTIGYGHIAPSTHLGRGICILYAFIGIPLFALMFSGLGDRIAGRFKKLEGRIRRRAKHVWVQKIIPGLIVLTCFLVLCMLVPSAIFMSIEGWSYSDSFYYSFITLTTIGFGDFVAGTNPEKTYVPLYRIMVYFWILFGMAFMATVISIITDFWKKTGEKAGLGRSHGEDEVDGGEDGNRVAENRSADDGDAGAYEEPDKTEEKMMPNSSYDGSCDSLEERPFNPLYENTKTVNASEGEATDKQEQSP